MPRRLLLLSSDERLVERVGAGDDAAFELLVERHVLDAVWFASEALGSHEEAEEAVRHSFAAAHAYLVRGDGRDVSFAPWLHTILANHCVAMLQERRGADDPGGAEELATVVDLDEWRRRRKQLAIVPPLVPTPSFQESVLAACGIGAGAGATTAGGALLGGTLAKVAMVVVLAGGAGVAGDVVSSQPGEVGRDGPSTPAEPLDGRRADLPRRASAPRDAAVGPVGKRAPQLGAAPDAGGQTGNVSTPSSDLAVDPPAHGGYAAPVDGALPSAPAQVGLPVGTGLQPPAGRAPPLPVEAPVVRQIAERLEQLPEAIRSPKIRLPGRIEAPKVEPRPVKLPPVKLTPVKRPAVKRPPVGLPPVKLPGVVKAPTGVEPPPVGDDRTATPHRSPLDLGAVLRRRSAEPPPST